MKKTLISIFPNKMKEKTEALGDLYCKLRGQPFPLLSIIRLITRTKDNPF